MAKLIHTNFESDKEAKVAQEYLVSSGLTDVSVSGNELNILTNSDNWISAFEIVSSLGGSIENDSDFHNELKEYYRIQEIDEQEQVMEPEIEIIDDDAYIDSNLGYGDYELLEPYVLEKYGKWVEKQDKDT